MNKENILKVADAIEQHSIPDLGFNMSIWVGIGSLYEDKSGHKCGTVGCIAGWATTVKNQVDGKGLWYFEKNVEEEYNQVREDCVEYSAELFDPNNEDHIEELNTPRYGGNLDNV